MISNFLFFFFFCSKRTKHSATTLHPSKKDHEGKQEKSHNSLTWEKIVHIPFFYELLSIKFSRITARAKARDLFFNIISLFLAIEILCYIYLNLKDLLCLIRNDKSKCTIFGYFCRIVMPA